MDRLIAEAWGPELLIAASLALSDSLLLYCHLDLLYHLTEESTSTEYSYCFYCHFITLSLLL